MNWLPSVVDAQHRGEYRLRLRFNDGVEKTVDLDGCLEGPIFEPLRDPSYFSRFVEGGTVVWPNGADIAPEALYGARAAEDAA